MFGYVAPVEKELDPADAQKFRSYYCGTCHAMGRIARFTLTYDCAFLALTQGAVTGGAVCCRKRCPAKPYKKVDMVCDAYTEYAADINTLLAYYNLCDDIRDEGGIKKRIARWLLKGAYRRVKKRRAFAAEQIEASLMQLQELEESKSADVDAAAGSFANLLQTVAAPGGDREGPLGRLFYNIGRWIYLVDALQDWEEDAKNGTYNVLIYRYGDLEKAREEMAFSLWHTLSEAEQAAEQLAPHEALRPVIDHVIHLSLPARTLLALQKGGRDAESL